MDASSTLINRRCFFYNSRFLCHSGFPKYHILNMIKPSISGAKELLVTIFGIPASFIDEYISDRTGVCESSCDNWSILSILKDLIRNAQHCQYRKLLTRHCPVQIKQPRKGFLMSSSKIMDSLSSMEGYGTQDKEALPIIHGNTDKASKSVAFYLASSLQAVPRCTKPHVESDCLLHSEPLNDLCLFKHNSNLESQHVNLGNCVDEENHAAGSLPKNSSVHRVLVKRKNEGHYNSEINGHTNGCNSKYTNMPQCKYMEPTNSLENELIKSFSSHKEVVSFLWAVCRRIIPEDLIGSKRNWRTLRSNLGKFVKLRRFENFTLRQCMHKIRTSHFPWLNGATSTCRCHVSLTSLNDKCSLESNEQWAYHCGTDRNKSATGSHKFLLQERMLANWIYWFFSGLIVPLIQAHFYVTETENGRQNVFYFRKHVWAKIFNGAVKTLTRKNYKRLSDSSLASILQKRSLGFSRVRILPKSNGVRPIANLGAPSTTWLHLHKDPVKPVKRRKISSFRNNMLILERINGGKCQNQTDMIENSMLVSIDNSQIRDNQDAGVEGDFLNSNGLISDKLKRNFNLYGSDSKVKVAFRSVNSLLCDVHHCLKFEQENCPEALGCSVFDYNDIYLKFMPFVLGLKDYCMGQPKLYIAVCDVAQAFDTVDQDKLLDVIQHIVQKEDYFVQRYSKVSCGMKSMKVSYERHAIAKKGTSFEVFSNTHSSKQSQGVFIDQAFFTSVKKDKLLGLIHEHVKRNILQIGPHFYIQKVGIPQGSVLSSLLCSFYFGDLDQNKILPLLGHTQKQHNMVSHKAIFGHGIANGFLPPRKVCSEGSCVEVNTTFFDEINRISGIATRYSRSTGVKGKNLNAGLSACTGDIPYHYPSDNVNEHKLPKSILLRLIDDLLFISTSKEKAVSFIASMHMGFKDYNCYAKKCKTSLNFEMELEGVKLPKKLYKSKDGSCFIRWSGILINCHTLEIQADYTRYSVSHISSTLTVWRQKNPGYYLMVKLCQFMRPKCHPIFYDSNINSPTTVRLNAYQAFLLCAMKFHSYICSVPSVGAFSPKHAFQTIMKSMRYIVSFIAPIHDVIRYADTDSPNLGEIYETFDSMVEQMKKIICAKDPSFFQEHIEPIIMKRWNKMNTSMHMAAHALNPKWYAPREGKKTPNNDTEVKDGFKKFWKKVYSPEEAAIIRAQFMQFTRLRGPRFSTPECREDRITIAQNDPIGWWDLYGDDTPELKQLAVRLLSQVGSSSAAERNWSTYGFIHSMRRNRLTPKRAEKLVAVHSYLRLRERVKPEYRASPVARWDIDPVEAANLEIDDDVEGLVGLPLHLEGMELDDEGTHNSSDSFDEEDDHDSDNVYDQNILGAHEALSP